MRKGIITIVFLLITTITFAQKRNIVNASIALRHANEAKGDDRINSLLEAKEYIDEAYETESTSNEPKMWNYRSQVYLKIATTKDQIIDKEAVFKATEAYLKCMQTDKKGRIIVRRWTSEEDVRNNLINCGLLLNNLAIKKINEKDFNKAIECYDIISEIVPYDSDEQLKRGNITKLNLTYSKFYAFHNLKDKNKSKELLQELINNNYNEPSIYKHMSDIYLEEGNSDTALEYLSIGREMFEEDQGLIIDEINLYLQLERTSELIIKLTEAILLDPENEIFYLSRGTIYDQLGEFKNAENDYKESLVLNPDNFSANYNLGALHFNRAIEINNKANASDGNVYNKLKKQAKDLFAKALPYLEEAYTLNSKDKNTLLSLKQLYYMNDDYAKSEEMKKQLANLGIKPSNNPSSNPELK